MLIVSGNIGMNVKNYCNGELERQKTMSLNIL